MPKFNVTTKETSQQTSDVGAHFVLPGADTWLMLLVSLCAISFRHSLKRLTR